MSLFHSLVTGLEDDERSRTIGVIVEQTVRARADAVSGHAPRQVDVGPRGRRTAGRRHTPRQPAPQRQAPQRQAPQQRSGDSRSS